VVVQQGEIHNPNYSLRKNHVAPNKMLHPQKSLALNLIEYLRVGKVKDWFSVEVSIQLHEHQTLSKLALANSL
jgi:hypothetical protein